ncbi:hypothetical protein SpiGrapes_2516 [Sphaerochaeta pleomorpha str. Grapes]|uniref:DUF308 domain-containing protein n=1 Tax=Sphaerochaeta pleomorpha (strain ATCC BAA-1885 / DSM 22778 / Grapes) TaxID=158190 RepID=G8QU30_SPHPG|nr:DUF308 domain-containing protein [Sphaerochaeta pleomorpha]AEV30277.1 hypothetical protein SpiGrapes_2516 [Sphaerochaeta pleomorpha str. Grapes]
MEKSFLKRHLNIALFTGVVIAALGLYMLFQSESFVEVLVTILGISMVLSGIYAVFSMRSYAWGKKSKILYLLKSLGSILIGALAVILPFTVANISWNVLIYLLAAQLAISAVVSLFNAVILRKGEKSVSPIFAEALFSLVFAILLFAFPRQIGSMILKIIGFVIFASGLGIVVWSSWIKRISRQFKDSSAIESTAELIEEKDSNPRD